MARGRTRQLSISPGMKPEMLRLISEQRLLNKEFDRRKPLTSPTQFFDSSNRPDATQNGGRVIFVKQANGALQGQYSDGAAWQTFLATSVSFATPTITYGTTFGAGTLSTTIRSDAQLKYPIALMSAANSSTLTLTDDATDQTLTGNLGTIVLSSPTNKVQADYWFSAGGTAPSAGAVLNFTGASSIVGSTLNFGINAGLQFASADTWSGTKTVGKFISTCSSIAGQVFSALTEIGVDVVMSATAIALGGANTWTARIGERINMGGITGAQAGTHTDTMGLQITGWPQAGTAGTYTNARALRIQQPTIGGTIRRGISIETVTLQVGTEPANCEGVYCEDITRGTAQRANFYAEGATNSTPTDVYAFYQGTAHTVGTNRYGVRVAGATTGTPTLCVAFYADAHSVGTTQWAFYSAGDESHMVGVQQDDNSKDVYGTGRDAELYYDGTDFVADPDVVGTGSFDIRGPLKCDSITNDTGLAAGVYTPTLTNVTNVAASTAYECQYMRVGNTVTVGGKVDVDPTAAGATQLGISLPVASNFGAVEDCGGAAFAPAIAGQGAAIIADAANNRAEMNWIAVDITNQPMFFSFTYQVI